MADKVLDSPIEENKDNDALKDLQNSDDVAKLRSVLQPEEKVFNLVTCMNDGSDGVLATTSLRVLFCDQRFLSSEVVEFSYNEIAAVVSESELITTKIALIGIDKALYLDGIAKDHADRLLLFLEKNIGQDFVASGDSGRHLKHIGELLNTDDISGSMPSVTEAISHS